jgi:WD40 repeat protein
MALSVAGHAHWVWQVAFSPRDPRLLLSGSSDGTAALWSIDVPAGTGASQGGAPPPGRPRAPPRAASGAGRGAGAATASRVDALHAVHADSVYGAAWGSVDPLLLATLSAEGHFVLCRVPWEAAAKAARCA